MIRPPSAASPPASPPAAAGAGHVGHVDAVLGGVHTHEPLQAPPQQLHLGRRGALLRPEHLGGVAEPGAHVAGHDQLHAPQAVTGQQRPQRSEPSVGGGRAADADDDPPGAPLERRLDEFARPVGGGRQRIVAFGAAHELQTRRLGHLDDCRAAAEAPTGRDEVAQGVRHHRVAIGSAEGVQGALPAVGQR